MNDLTLKNIYLWREKKLTSTFKSGLYDLLHKATLKDRVKLGEAYPDDYNAYMCWEKMGDENFVHWLREEEVLGPKPKAWKVGL